MKIGFIGLGIMGKPMVKNIIKGGYTDVLVNGRHQDVLDEMEACGAKSATYEEIGRQCDVVMTMLPNSPQVKEVCIFPLHKKFKSGTCLVCRISSLLRSVFWCPRLEIGRAHV